MITKNRSTSVHCGLALLVGAVMTWGGCGRSAVKLSSEDRRALEQAAPEVKQVWQRALAADKAKDYLSAQTLLDSLGEMQLSEAQKLAVDKERESFNERLWQAAEKNDPAAVKVVQASQKNRRPAPPTPSQ